MIKKPWAGVAAALCLALFTCTTNDNIAGNASQTGNPSAVAGIIYQPDGITPAAGVRVAIRPKKTLADTSGFGLPKRMTDTATVMTDDSGRFVFDTTLDTGLYVIEADDGDSNLALIDSVHVAGTDTGITVEDTLQPAGSITGIVYLSEGGDPRKVFILAYGIDRFTRPDSSGRFRFGNLAEEVYDLTLISSLDDYAVLDTFGIPVVSQQVTDLDTLRLPFTGIPTVKGLALSYDTLKQIVTLTWNQADTALVQGYNIYRQHVDSGLVKINGAVITDTVYRDSAAMQDQTYTYQVKAVDKTGNEGLLSAGVGVEVVSGFVLISEIVLDSLRNDPIGFTVSQDTTIYVAFRGSNGGGFVGVFDKTGQNTASLGENLFTQLYGVAVDSRRNVYAIDPDGDFVIKFNDSGDSVHRWSVEQPFHIVIDRQDNIFVFHRRTRITEFDTLGNIIDTTSGDFSNDAGNLVSGQDGRIYAKEDNSNRLLVFDSDLSSPEFTTFAPIGYLRAVDGLGNIYMREGGFVFVYSPTGERIARWKPNTPFDRLCILSRQVFVLDDRGTGLLSMFSIPF